MKEKGPIWKLNANDDDLPAATSNGVNNTNGTKNGYNPAPALRDVIGASLKYVGAYKKLDNKKQVVALIDDVIINARFQPFYFEISIYFMANFSLFRRIYVSTVANVIWLVPTQVIKPLNLMRKHIGRMSLTTVPVARCVCRCAQSSTVSSNEKIFNSISLVFHHFILKMIFSFYPFRQYGAKDDSTRH